ncbi:MAG TPA: hypothetical protein P5250_01580 [Bacteroidales bacterium]|nr:hypothetical protein [Bacteroidales bacterium]
MFKFFKKDSLILGIIIGFILPLISYGVFYLIMQITTKFNSAGIPMIKNSTTQLIAIFSNMFILRYYLINKKADKTGRGVLITTFILAFAFFIKNM